MKLKTIKNNIKKQLTILKTKFDNLDDVYGLSNYD